MADTLTPEKWGRKESADWWSAGQAARQQNYGAATEMMLDLAGVQAGSRVLDVAAGTGESALMAAARVGPKGHVLAADVSAAMLNVAAEAARKAGLTNVETRVMNAENLELDMDSFDAVICRIALMLFSAPDKALDRMRRVVKPGGKVAVMVHAALGEESLSWRFFRRQFAAWETYHRQRRANPGCSHWALRECLKESTGEAGFQNVSVNAAPIPRGFPSAAAAVGNMRKGAGDLRELMMELKEADREIAWAEIEEKFRRFEGPNGFEIPGEALIGVGTK